jgi:hypothetical protein
MKKAFAVGLLALAASACGGPDVGYYCEETAACSESMGITFGGFDFVEICEDSSESQLDDVCKSSEVDAIDKAIEDCKDKKGCAFVTCIGAKEPEAFQCLIPDYGGFDSECGDDIADIDEDCDGTDLWGETCDTLIGGDGTLTCTSDCTFDTRGCM